MVERRGDHKSAGYHEDPKEEKFFYKEDLELLEEGLQPSTATLQFLHVLLVKKLFVPSCLRGE
jgi:hypothetical protein